ncbi:hypothetical protein [Prosthecobacter sp.]|uniref:hypothetical protein n=1 Tax=Prosthecobacter sp. TaxID=1965333 RepID=UPI0025CDD8D8|nr:hypothetical protein [Prosthecobacter sp.]
MPSHFSSLGMPVESMDDVYRLAQSVDAQTQTIPSQDGSYLYWSSNSGAQLWLQVTPKREFAGMNPHFSGPARMKVRLTAYIPSTTPSAMDGSFHGWADPTDDGAEGAYPFVFDAPDASAHRNRKLPEVVDVQLAAFAHELSAYDNPEAYDAAQSSKELKLASESFIPSGLFGDGEGSKALGMMTGTILATERKTNELTGKTFWWALVQSLGGQFDVVADDELVSAPLVVGGVLQGSFWLSGRILAPPPAASSGGFFSRLFGKKS